MHVWQTIKLGGTDSLLTIFSDFFSQLFDLSFKTLDSVTNLLFNDGVSKVIVEFRPMPAEQAGILPHSVHLPPNPREVAGLRTVVNLWIAPYCCSFTVGEERTRHSFVFCIAVQHIQCDITGCRD